MSIPGILLCSGRKAQGQDPASTCFVPLSKQTAFSFSVSKAALHLFKWQLQRPSVTLNNNRKLNQRICRGIQSFPFHHRLQRPFFLKGSQEYAGQWSSPSLQSLLWPCLFPQAGGWGQVLPLAKWSHNPGRDLAQTAVSKGIQDESKLPLHLRNQGNLLTPFAPTSIKSFQMTAQRSFQRATIKYFCWEEFHLCWEWEAALGHLLSLSKVKCHYFLPLIIAIY